MADGWLMGGWLMATSTSHATKARATNQIEHTYINHEADHICSFFQGHFGPSEICNSITAALPLEGSETFEDLLVTSFLAFAAFCNVLLADGWLMGGRWVADGWLMAG